MMLLVFDRSEDILLIYPLQWSVYTQKLQLLYKCKQKVKTAERLLKMKKLTASPMMSFQ